MKFDLSEICYYVKDKIPVSELNLNNYISTENMLPNKAGIEISSGLPTASTQKTQSYNRDDVLVSNIRPYFKKIWYARNDGGCSNDVLVFRAKKGVDPLFLYYVLSDDAFFAYATSTSKGTKMPRGDKISIMQYKVPDIDLNTQKRISGLLGDIDKKIEINSAINQNLEQQAQLIFNAEFLSNTEIPVGWEESNLLAIADYLNGLAMQKFRPTDDDIGLPVLKIKELRQGMCDDTSERCSSNISPKYIVYDGDVIFSWSGSLLVDFWCGGMCGLNQHLFKVTSSKFDKWFYYAWTKHYLTKFASVAADMATTMGHIKREELSKSKVLIPSEEDYNRIGSVMRPIYESIIANRIQNRELSNIRDILIPKLMSGELDVSEITI